MDLLALASYATFVSVVGQFLSGRADKKHWERQADYNEFLEWLIEQNHTDVKIWLEDQSQLIEGIKKILEKDLKLVLKELESINKAMVSFSSGIDGFSQIAQAIDPNAMLSEQAISILCQLEESQGSKFLEISAFRGEVVLSVLDSKTKNCNIETSDLRFLDDDLKKLIELGLLRHERNSKGGNVYLHTRSSSELAKRIMANKG